MQVAPAPVKPKNRGWIWALGVLVVVALAGLGVAWAAGVFDNEEPAKKVAVPDLAGMTQQGARSALSQAGLKVGKVVSERATRARPAPSSRKTRRPARRSPRVTRVALTLSSGASPSPPPTGDVPDVVGSTQAEAEQTLGRRRVRGRRRRARRA